MPQQVQQFANGKIKVEFDNGKVVFFKPESNGFVVWFGDQSKQMGADVFADFLRDVSVNGNCCWW